MLQQIARRMRDRYREEKERRRIREVNEYLLKSNLRLVPLSEVDEDDTPPPRDPLEALLESSDTVEDFSEPYDGVLGLGGDLDDGLGSDAEEEEDSPAGFSHTVRVADPDEARTYIAAVFDALESGEDLPTSVEHAKERMRSLPEPDHIPAPSSEMQEVLETLLEDVPVSLVRQLAWDTMPCSTVPGLLTAVGGMPASEDVMEREHIDCHDRLDDFPQEAAVVMDWVGRSLMALTMVAHSKVDLERVDLDGVRAMYSRAIYGGLQMLRNYDLIDWEEE
jgi:hypothetical protein